METMTVIKHFNIFYHVTSGFVPGFINNVSGPLVFKGVEKTLHYGIIPAVRAKTGTSLNNQITLFESTDI